MLFETAGSRFSPAAARDRTLCGSRGAGRDVSKLLRQYYDRRVSGPLPENLTLLLAQLVEAEAKHRQLLELTPHLKAFAISLCHSLDHADDLVQTTLLKAWSHRDDFVMGTNMKAWLFAILRNSFLSEIRKRKYEVEDQDGGFADCLSIPSAQLGHLMIMDLSKALDSLSKDQREVLILICAEGLSYDEVASRCGCAIGTIKSRLNRARAKLCGLMGVKGGHEFGPDQKEVSLARTPLG